MKNFHLPEIHGKERYERGKQHCCHEVSVAVECAQLNTGAFVRSFARADPESAINLANYILVATHLGSGVQIAGVGGGRGAPNLRVQ